MNFTSASANLSSPPRFDLLIVPRPSSSKFNLSSQEMKDKRIYSHVAIVEATTATVSFHAQYLPTVEHETVTG